MWSPMVCSTLGLQECEIMLVMGYSARSLVPTTAASPRRVTSGSRYLLKVLVQHRATTCHAQTQTGRREDTRVIQG